jgi:hypothetical protein
MRLTLAAGRHTLRDNRQMCNLLLASDMAVQHKIHLMPFVAGHGHYHVDIGW